MAIFVAASLIISIAASEVDLEAGDFFLIEVSLTSTVKLNEISPVLHEIDELRSKSHGVINFIWISFIFLLHWHHRHEIGEIR